jgi:MSHA biogenesis protein MshI
LLGDSALVQEDARGRLLLELQRSFDHFDRQFPFVSLAKLVIGPEPKDTGLAGYLSQNLGISVEQGRLEDVLDLGPRVTLVGDEAWRLFYVLGAALRSEAKAL